MSEQAMAFLEKLLATRTDASGAHCPADPPPPPEKIDGETE